VVAVAVDADVGVVHAAIDVDYASVIPASELAAVVDGHADSAIVSLSLAHRRHCYRHDDGSRVVVCSSPLADRLDALDADDADFGSGSYTRMLRACVAAPPTGRSGKALSSGWRSAAAASVPLAAPCPHSSRLLNSCDLARGTADFATPLCHDGPSQGLRPNHSYSVTICVAVRVHFSL